METIETYLDEIAAAGAGKIIISKPANKAEEYKKIVIEKKESYFQAAAYTQKQVFHENIRMEELGSYLKTTVSGFYLQVNAWDETTEYILLISKKGKVTRRKRKKRRMPCQKRRHPTTVKRNIFWRRARRLHRLSIWAFLRQRARWYEACMISSARSIDFWK